MNLLYSPARRWIIGIPPLRPPDRPADPPGEHLSVAHPIFADRIRALHAQVRLRVNSLYRSRADQQLFFDCMNFRKANGRCPDWCRRSECNDANPPGRSNHEAATRSGRPASLAADIYPVDGNWSRLHERARGLDLHFPIRSSDPRRDEPWHVQPTEVRAGTFDGFPPDWD